MGKLDKTPSKEKLKADVAKAKPSEKQLVQVQDSKIKKKKSKKSYKKFINPSKKDGLKKTVAALPKDPTLISSNWKNMLKILEKENEGKPPKPVFKRLPRPEKKEQKEEKVSTNPEVPTKKKPDIWFDDVDESLLDIEDRPGANPESITEVHGSGLVKEKAFKGPTHVIGMDCEMVGVGYGGKDSILARVSIVNHFGHCIYDKYVKPREKVTDYRTFVSGIRPKDIENGEDFKVVQQEVSDLIQGRILVGHALKHDLKVLFLDHPRKMIRDTSGYKYFRNAFGGRTPSLKNLSERMLGVKVQTGEHSSVQDAQAAVRLYTMFRKEWENELSNKFNKSQHNDNRSNHKVSNKGPVETSQTSSVVKEKKKLKIVKAVQKPGERKYYSDSD